MNLLFLISGLTILLWGAHFLSTAVASASRNFATRLSIIQLSIAACVASAPELAISIRAIVQNERPQVAMGLGVLAGACVANIGIALAAYTLARAARIGTVAVNSDATHPMTSWWNNAIAAVVGCVMVVVGSGLALDGAVGFASAKEIRPALVGLMLVSVSIAIPNLLRGVAAIRRGNQSRLILVYLGSTFVDALAIVLATLSIIK